MGETPLPTPTPVEPRLRDRVRRRRLKLEVAARKRGLRLWSSRSGCCERLILGSRLWCLRHLSEHLGLPSASASGGADG